MGLGAVFLLNVPPDRRGRIHENDTKSLLGFRKLIDETFAVDLARKARVTVSDVRGNSEMYSGKKLVDSDQNTFWATNDSVRTPSITLEFSKPVEFNTIRLREPIVLGQRIDSVEIDAEIDNRYVQIATATSIGQCRLIQVEPVKTSRVRLRVKSLVTNPCLSEVGLFLDPNEAP